VRMSWETLATIRALAQEIATEGDERALIIAEEVDRLNRFVADLLDLSRLTAGGMRLSIALNAAEDVMGATLQRVHGMLAGREIRATIDTDEPVLVGRFDFSHTLRILVNLLENALKYAPPGQPVDFTVRRDHGEIVFAVADRGPGIAATEHERVFDAFYRPPGAAPDVGGAGLGLAIAQGLAAAQGGTVRYDARPGGGSVFSLRLPAADLTAADVDFA
jgi:two-component system, OmpR family, sensor histidine kinase KdpD